MNDFSENLLQTIFSDGPKTDKLNPAQESFSEQVHAAAAANTAHNNEYLWPAGLQQHKPAGWCGQAAVECSHELRADSDEPPAAKPSPAPADQLNAQVPTKHQPEPAERIEWPADICFKQLELLLYFATDFFLWLEFWILLCIISFKYVSYVFMNSCTF